MRVSPTRVTHHLSFGWCCLQRTRGAGDWCEPRWERFETCGRFWEVVEDFVRPRTRLYMFAHNWSFDGPVLGMFDELPRRGWKLGLAVIDSPPVILVWRKEDKTIKVLDTLNWWRMSLSKVGESLKLPKLAMPAASATREQWDTYCKRDVEVIHTVVHAWWDFLVKYDLGSFAPTLASQAFRAYRHRFMRDPILIDDNGAAQDLARRALHGGRTEAFRLGRITGPVHCLDVNSMYPAVMRANPFPTVLRLHVRRATLKEIETWCRDSCVISDCLVETKRPRFAHLHNKKLVFPVGRFREALTTPDLLDALTHDELIEVGAASVYDRAPIFESFVDVLYALRCEARARGDEVSTWLLKILMNSLYGKFAQRGETWETVGPSEDREVKVWREVDLKTATVRTYRKLAGVLQEKRREGESRDSHPAIAAHVTAYARAALWALISAAGAGEVYYVDTDSLYCSQRAFGQLSDRVEPDALGQLKHEATHDWLMVCGPKDYALPGKTIVKGVRSAARWLAPNEVEQEQWSTLAGLLRTGDLSAPTTTTTRKHLSRVYTKGRTSATGKVSPFRLREP